MRVFHAWVLGLREGDRQYKCLVSLVLESPLVGASMWATVDCPPCDSICTYRLKS